MNTTNTLLLHKKTEKIDGWFSLEAALIFAWIDDIQQQLGVKGDLFEIGVHHGKSAVLLGTMAANRQERFAICDIFGDSTSNVSRSGQGNREIFERNMVTYVAPNLQLQLFTKLSSDLTPDEIGYSYRFFHIDGGHNADEALADLELARTVLVDKGIIAIDDPFRPEWPGVTEAILEFLRSYPDYCALVVGFNKLLLAQTEHAQAYWDPIDDPTLLDSRGIEFPWRLKELPFAGNSLRIFHTPSWYTNPSLRSRMRRFYRKHSWTHHPVMKPLTSTLRSLKN